MPLRIVYIDDEPVLCDILKESLESATVIVDTFTDVNAAISSIERSPPDLVFIDYRLTDTTGDKVAERISEYKTNNPPFLLNIRAFTP